MNGHSRHTQQKRDNMKRRDFIKITGGIAVGMMAPLIAVGSGGKSVYGENPFRSSDIVSRINERQIIRKFENDISEILQTFMFELNDEYTRLSAYSLVDEYLRVSQTKMRINKVADMYHYQVICDKTNNWPEIIDNNKFIMDVMVNISHPVHIKFSLGAGSKMIETNGLI